MNERMQDRIAIITGASRGIGAATAEVFAREGAKVVIASRKQEALDEVAATINETYPDAVLARACHIGEPDQVAALVDWTLSELGLPDALVNNAATNPYFGPMLQTPETAWDKTFEVNLKGYFSMTREVAGRLVAQERPGSIVNVSSIAGLIGMPLQGVYSMTKAAILSMTRTLAVELGPSKIRVNAVAPGLVDTRLAEAITESSELSKFFTDRAPLHRIAQPGEVAEVILHLASEESSYMTGHVLPVDGGFTVA